MNTKTDSKAQFSVNAAAFLIYLAYRILGATKKHAWDSAKLHTVNAVMDKTVEKIGIVDPRHRGKDGIQAYFTAGGPLDGCSRFIEECRSVRVQQDAPESGDLREHIYERTQDQRGSQIIFQYLGLEAPTAQR